MWADSTANAYPDWVQINFNGSKTLNRAVVYTLQDNYTSPIEPTDTLAFALYGIKDFTVQGWDSSNSSWVTLATVTGNNLVKRTVTFAAYTTDRIRVNVTSALATYSRIVEIEAWGVAADTIPGTFAFPQQFNAPLNSSVISSAVAVSGINTATAISITGGQ